MLRFSQVLNDEIDGFDRFYIPGNNRFSQVRLSDMLSFVKFLYPQKYKVLLGSAWGKGRF